MPLYKLLIYNIGADCLILVDGYCQYLTIQILQICTFYMNTREARKIANLIQRQSYIENYEQLQLICLNLNLDVDFDYVYFTEEVELLSIASIYGISIDEKNLYILTKNNQLHSVNLQNREHSIFDLNKFQFRFKIKLFLNKIIINH